MKYLFLLVLLAAVVGLYFDDSAKRAALAQAEDHVQQLTDQVSQLQAQSNRLSSSSQRPAWFQQQLDSSGSLLVPQAGSAPSRH